MTRRKADGGKSDPGSSPCVTAAMRAASRRLTMLYDEVMAPSGLRVTQYSILSELSRRSSAPPTVGELSERLVIERSAMGQTLRPLERDGLIAFGRDEQDGRRRPVQLTRKGQDTVSRARPYWNRAHEQFGRFYGEAAREELRKTLLAIAENSALSNAFDSNSSKTAQPQTRKKRSPA